MIILESHAMYTNHFPVLPCPFPFPVAFPIPSTPSKKKGGGGGREKQVHFVLFIYSLKHR